MITLVVPTRNRTKIIGRVAGSYFAQALVSEVVLVNDAGSDDTDERVSAIAQAYPATRLRIIRNATRLGASQSRNIGVSAATNDLILFCDDDEFLEPGYAAVCLRKLQEHKAAAVSGRRVYMRPGETPEGAVARFGSGLRRTPPFRRRLCEYVNGARFEGDLELPFTNAVILTRKSLLQRYPFDPFYARGNGYREETDYQMQLFVNGYKIVVTNETHSIHLPLDEVRTGGQRVRRAERIYWSIFYTRYFFRKYYRDYARRLGLSTPMPVALGLFACFAAYREYIRPLAYPVALALAERARPVAARSSEAVP
jgi:glycosyltransferase involved in cell wall biosynthesis